MLYIRLIRPLFHIAGILGAFYIVYIIRQHTDLIPYIHIKAPFIDKTETAVFAFISSFAFLLVNWFFGIYKLWGPIHWYHRKFFKSWIIWFIIITFIAYFGKDFVFKNWISRLIIIWWWLFSLLIITLFDIVLNYINTAFEKKQPYKILIITNKRKYFLTVKSFFSKYDIYNIDYNLSSNIAWNKIKDYDIVLIVWNLDIDMIENINDITRLNNAELYYFPESSFLEDILYHPSRLWPLILWKYKPSPLEWWWRVAKRIFDIVFSLLFFLLFWWVYVAVAIFIYLKDGKPIIYKSVRVGRWEKLFWMYKFRTMVKDAEKLKQQIVDKNERKWPLFKIKDDPRILPWWKFLRKTSIDEIPQFWNVLKWDMSITWPRPHLPEEVAKYKKWQKRVLSVKPWITGYAQVFGRDLPFDKEARLDLYRIQKWSIWMDIFVIIGTLKTILKWK